MTDFALTTGGYTDGDIDTNRTNNPSIHDILDARYSRRQAIFGGAKAAAAVSIGSFALAACGDDENTPANVAPQVSAGQSGTSASGRMVTLAGTATDSNGTIAATSWTQISGPTVALSSGTAANTMFLAPSVTTSTPLGFRFSATDDAGFTVTSDTTVTVGPAELGFTAVPKSLADTVAVPAGYTVTVLYRLGDPINNQAGAYANDGTDTGFANRAGDHHDGMYFFGLAATGTTPDANSNTRGVLAINHENITESYLHVAGPTAVNGVRPTAEVVKEIECHGVSMIEVNRSTAGAWSYSTTSTLNRRITPFTPTTINGPARGHPLMRTAFSPDGTAGRGTINNCANGFTPWGTYITAEENWAGYFRRAAGDDAVRTAAGLGKTITTLNRYGQGGTRAGNYNWTTAAPIAAGDTRISKFDITANAAAPADGTGDFRFETNQYGWIVEIDPYDPAAAPRKRTALGRMNHEGAWPGLFVAGRRPAWYTGDDQQNDYLYKFVSSTPWAAADATAANRLAIGDKYLDAGTLYVARFDATGNGVWLPLIFGQNGLTSTSTVYPFADQGDVLINARLAADVVGATRMDRPEWTGVNPKNGEMYLTLTNNAARTSATTDAANPRAYIDPPSNSRSNRNGHIIRLREAGDSTEATTFSWDIYLFGSGADLDPTNVNLSALDPTNDLSSPDGLWFSRPSNASGLVNPLLWIQTDDGAYTDTTNCMMLVGMPGTVGDGARRTISNILPDGSSRTQETIVGKAPGALLRRFLVGPKGCEITGIDSTPDGRSVFVNIQHPGEGGSGTNITSNWPANQSGTAAPTSRPRSSTIVITKNDGGVVGL